MLRKAKSRRRAALPKAEVNVVSLMDILTSLLFFLILFISFQQLTVIQATALPQGASEQDDQKPTFVLQVNFLNKKNAQIVLGPTKGLKMVEERKFVRRMRSYRGRSQVGFLKKIRARNAKHLIQKIQKALIPIRQSFPHKNKITLAFSDQMTYQQIIDSMSGLKSLTANQKPFLQKNLLGKTEKTRVLFPEIMIMEWTRT